VCPKNLSHSRGSWQYIGADQVPSTWDSLTINFYLSHYLAFLRYDGHTLTEPSLDTRRAVALDAAGESSASKPTSTRWLILILMSLMYLILYMDRSNIGIGAPAIAKEFGMSKTAMGFVFGAFAWAYALGQIPAGWFGDRFGPKRVLLVLLPAWALMAALTGVTLGVGSLISARFLLGLFEAGAFPVATRGMQLWFAKSERGRAQGITHCFSRLAIAITPFIAVSILAASGWRAIFYIFGSLGALWSLAFYLLYTDRPEDHKGVNESELASIRGRNLDGTIRSTADLRDRPAVPWKRIFRSPNMGYIAAGYFCFFYGTYFFLTWYPTYLLEHRHLTLKSVGIVASLPLLCGVIGDVAGGSLTDAVYRKTQRLKFARRIVAAPALLISGALLIPAATTNSASSALFFLAASFFSLELVVGPAWAVPMDVGGEFSGTVAAVMNMAGAVGASISPIVFGFFAQRGFWVAPFVVTACVLLTCTLIWIFLINPEKSVVS
jgi:sugar phosphate permease